MKEQIEVFWFSEQAYSHVTDEDLGKYDSGRLGFPNTYFDPEKAHVLYNYEGKYYHYRVVNPWVLPIQQPHPPIWFPGLSSPESVVWAARHQHPYMNLGSLLEHTELLRQVYVDTAKEVGFQPAPEHFGYLLRVLVADTDEKAQDIGRTFMWTEDHRNKGPREHNDPPGYQSRQAVQIQRTLPGAGGFVRRMSYEELQAVDNVIVGSPDTVAKKLTSIIDSLVTRPV